MSKILALADTVTVSTEKLRSQFDHFEKNGTKIVTIPNAFSDHIFNIDRQLGKPNPLVMWRGSQTHAKDLAHHMSGMMEWFGNANRSKWTAAMTLDPEECWFLTERVPKKRCIFVKRMDIIDYHRFIIKTSPSVMMVPLHDSEFNMSKSNIAWLEAAYAGMAAVIPDWSEEWAKVPGFHYSHNGAGTDYKGSFYEAMMEATSDLGVARAKAHESWEYVKDCLILSKVNKKREEVIYSLIDSDRMTSIFASKF